jgi:hypothetical protein
LAGSNIHRQGSQQGWRGLPGADERPVMQEFKLRTSSNSEFTDKGQFPGDKTGQLRAELDEFKLIRGRSHSDAARRHAAFAVHH